MMSEGSTDQPTQCDHRVEPEPKKQWVTILSRRSRKIIKQPAESKQNAPSLSSRFVNLADGSDDEEEGTTAIPTTKDGQASTEISSNDPENQSQTTTTETDKEKLHLVTSKPPKQLATPQLVTLKQRERAALIQAVKEIDICRGDQPPMAKSDSNHTRDFPGIEEVLGIGPVTTPSSGNCMAMASAQAVADHDLAAHDGSLEAITASIKQGIRFSGHLNFDEQFDHYVRTATLITCRGGGMA
ncbi:unnamed protein product [Peronospora destructor]|uniref:Uncharacterized protein n=1 Tax=Peronospora destructor TaxID=86335 RepID=A0AAV0T388_9STRA|nr:unnamed protein product [Peronospora destructor]